MKTKLLLSILLCFSSLIFADIGPAPSGPEIHVNLTEDGQPVSGSIQMWFVCSEAPFDDGGPLADRVIKLACSQSVCRNDVWFYKLNPCFFGDGSFVYSINGGGNKTSQEFSFLDGHRYDVGVEAGVGTGSITKTEKPESLCWLPFALLAVAVLFSWRK